MAFEKYLWIRTRDGSSTLWDNELSETFRSVKGAFTESWNAFVQPSLKKISSISQDIAHPLEIMEFGLGPGTNWILWSQAAQHLGLSYRYAAIEKDLSSFELGLHQWQSDRTLVTNFLKEKFSADFQWREISLLPKPITYCTMDSSLKDRHNQVQLWWHDPFGFEVNPEAYEENLLKSCARLWSDKGFFGFSYACNRRFRECLGTIPQLKMEVVPTGGEGLKRERLEFWRIP